MYAVTRCKMKVESVMQSMDSAGKVEQEVVKLRAVMGDSPENKEWSRWTPHAQFEISISNPAAMGKLSKGHEFFVDFTPAT